MNKPHLSVSQLEMLGRCGLQWRYRYLEGKRRPPGVAAYTGRGTHRSVELNLIHVMESPDQEMLPEPDALDVARDKVNGDWGREEPLLTPEERAEGIQKVRGRSVDAAVTLAKLHYEQVAPGVQPIAVERAFVLELHGFPYDFHGVIDLQEPRKIRDLKTKGASPSKADADASLQLTAYHLGVQVLDREAPEIVQLDSLVMTKTPKVVQHASTRTAADHRRLLRRIEMAAEVIEKEAFLPAPEDSWVCSERYCGYWNECEFGQRGRTRKGG